MQYAENVALGLAGLANILDPERIVIAGGIVELGALLFGPLREAFGRHLEGVDYRPADPARPRGARRARGRGGRGGTRTRSAARDSSGRPHLAVVRRGSRDPDRGRARGRGSRTRRGVRVRPSLARSMPPNRRPALECFALLGCGRGRDDAHSRRHACRAGDVAAAGNAGALLRHRAADQRRPSHRRRSARAIRRAEQRTKRSDWSSAPWPTASPRCTTRCARRTATVIRSGSAGAAPWCARSWRSPTAGTGGAASPERVRGGSCARARGRARRDDHVGRSREAGRGGRRRSGRSLAAVRRSRHRMDHHRSGRLVERRERRASSARCARG